MGKDGSVSVEEQTARDGDTLNTLNLSGLSELDRGRLLVNYAWVSRFSAGVAVVGEPFECAWFGSVAACPVRALQDFTDGFGECFAASVRGKNPPAL